MPLLEGQYNVPRYFRNGHVHTLYPFLLRKISEISYKRERIHTSDGDFLDLDWSKVGAKHLIILSHGLEGSSGQQYIKGMVRFFNQQGLDALAWNNRSCSGELNRLPSFYHSGLSQDLEQVIEHVLAMKCYDKIALIGFSMGANQTLKYLGEKGEQVPKEIIGAATFSCPVELESCSRKLAKKENSLYMINFLFSMKSKLLKKHWREKYDDINLKQALMASSFPVWDKLVTAPLSGFADERDYYQQASCLSFLEQIKIPTLLVNAKDDPFLDRLAFPRELAREHEFFHFESPEFGGHVAFMAGHKEANTWSELRAFEFLQQYFTG